MDLRENEDKGVQKREKWWSLTKVPYWESNTVPYDCNRSAVPLGHTDERRECAEFINSIRLGYNC